MAALSTDLIPISRSGTLYKTALSTLYTLFGIVKGLSGYCGGKPTASEVVLAAVSPYAFTIVQGNCSAKAQVAATASTVFQLKKNGSNVCTFTFAAAGTVATVGTVSSGIVAVGDVLTIHGPATPDTTLADIAFLVRE